jgi:polyisoprenyl-teichoic acid--peptidoglycan teichoic acid transferase
MSPNVPNERVSKPAISRSTTRAVAVLGALGVSASLLLPAITAQAAAKKPAAKPAAKTTSKTPAKPGTVKSKKPNTVLLAPNGRAPKPAGPFLWEIQSTDAELPSSNSFEAATTKIVPNNKLFKLLVIGSDARPGEPLDRTRGDSVHLIVWNPAWNKGIIVGFPRDSYVDIPGRGKDKLTSALAVGGPALMLQTVNNISKLNVENYVVTGFQGFTNMVNDIGGVNVLVDPQMSDPASGATFQKGWFAMNGPAALAFTRNRKAGVGSDLGRSLNQGRFLLYTLAKLREETSDVNGLAKWIGSFRTNTKTNLKTGDLMLLAQIARSIDPNNMQNVVLQGKNAKVKIGKLSQDVVQLDPRFAGFFQDISHDAVNDGR